MPSKQTSSQSAAQALARARALSHRAVRDQQNCFWIEGIRQFVQACDARLDFQGVIYSPVLLKSPLAQMLIRRLSATGVPSWKVSPEEFRSVNRELRASGVGAIVRQHWTRLDRATRYQGLGWLIVETIRAPGNLGTMLRTAEAIGMTGVLFVGPRCDPFDPAVVRASMGGMFPLPLARITPEGLEQWGRETETQFVGLSPTAEQTWTQAPLHSRVGLVVGDERTGLSESLRLLCPLTVRLPMTGRADSLNVATAAGVMMYELLRRTQAP